MFNAAALAQRALLLLVVLYDTTTDGTYKSARRIVELQPRVPVWVPLAMDACVVAMGMVVIFRTADILHTVGGAYNQTTRALARVGIAYTGLAWMESSMTGLYAALLAWMFPGVATPLQELLLHVIFSGFVIIGLLLLWHYSGSQSGLEEADKLSGALLHPHDRAAAEQQNHPCPSCGHHPGA